MTDVQFTRLYAAHLAAHGPAPVLAAVVVRGWRG